MKTTFLEKFAALKEFYKLHPKRFWVIGLLVVGGIFAYVSSTAAPEPTLVPVTKVELKQTVLSTGQVTSLTDIDLSFSTGGLIRTIPVAVGDNVVKGQTLASYDNRNEYAALMEARGALKQAQANYQKVIDGASSEDVAVSQALVDSAKANLQNVTETQDTLVENARRALLNADLTPILANDIRSAAPIVSGTYTGLEQGKYHVSLTGNILEGWIYFSGVEIGSIKLSTTSPVPLGTHGLFIQFPTTTSTASIWDVLLPNTTSIAYLTASNAYQTALRTHDSAIATAQATLNEAQASLNLKKAAARPSDVAVAEAAVMTAQAKVDAVQVVYDNTILHAQAAGTIVSIDTKIGERVEPQKTVMVLQDVTNLYVEANINETNIAKVALNQPVAMTLDAFGPDVIFTGKVIHLDPSATTNDGVVNYKIKASIDAGAMKNAANPGQINFKDAVRPGMNANMTITCADKGSVVAIPKATIITNPDNSTSVNLITNVKREKYKAVPVTIGFEGDGNMVEVVSGVVEGDTLALVK